MENCEERIEAISALIDGELSGEAALEIEAHLKDCAVCRALYDDFRAMSAAMAELSDDPAPAELTPGLLFRVGTNPSGLPRWKRLVGLCAAAAACIIVVLAMTHRGKFSDMTLMGYWDKADGTRAEVYSMAGGNERAAYFGVEDSVSQSADIESGYPTPTPSPTELPPQAKNSEGPTDHASGSPAPGPVSGTTDPTPSPSMYTNSNNLPGKQTFTGAGEDPVYGSYMDAEDAESLAFALRLSGNTGAALDYFTHNSILLTETGAFLQANITVEQLDEAVRAMPLIITNEPDAYSDKTDVGLIVIER